ncbi:acyl-CoA thioesterase domain-containing protein, partial [Amycolatopsis sp. SID8362]|uniref:acyl-CoA thioesterase domain-containing protein n=1 Tax=Amycolatopsis sp. SID8362 TaxID=2690346 RepID=UPI001368B8D6
MADAFYVPLGEGRFSATAHTAGPWSSEAQHFGPPSALLVRALENVEPAHPAELARVTVEILGPAPVAELTARARVERPGRSVELLQAE